MSEVQDSNLKKIGRVLYVEPNNAYLYEDKDGKKTVLTPPLEDLCISVNLTAYIQNRTKSKISTGCEIVDKDNIRKQFTITCISDPNEKTAHTFLSGTGEGKKRYLTTYYTDIAYENYGANKIVEGLGIDNIQISFQSWYTPTITIKFVDVRGSAIFGNEEALHDKRGNLTADHVFGCFMTIPYPLFRLQIKGFLGRPVTYQLTASDVKTEYNQNTGNFELTVQFIGYTYSLLTDIPISYLVAAPYMTYYGKDYWDGKVNSPEWALDNGHPPMKLYEFYTMIQGFQNGSNSAADSPEFADEASQIAQYDMEQTALNEMLSSFGEMRNEFFKLFTDRISGNEDGEQYLCFTKNASIDLGNFREKYQVFQTKVDSYNSTYTATAIKNSDLPDYGSGRGNVMTINGSDILKTHHAFKITTNNENIRTAVDFFIMSGDSLTEENVMDTALGTVKLHRDVAKQLIQECLRNPFKKVEEYCLAFDLGKFQATVQDRINKLEQLKTELKKIIDAGLQDTFISQLGWRPDIGNVFKMIMCHLETFVHVILHAGEDIYAQKETGLRTVQNLGIGSIEKTDFLDDVVDIGPWPQVMGPSVSLNDSQPSTSEESLAWVGDFSNNFIEQQVVEGIMGAMLRMKDAKEHGLIQGPKPHTYPLTPMDLMLSNPFIKTLVNNSVDSLAGQLAERVAMIFGLMGSSRNNDGGITQNISVEMAETLGKIDAYNYFLASESAHNINEDIFNKIGQGNLADILISIALAEDTYSEYGKTNPDTNKTRFIFETDTPLRFGLPNRHPMFIKNGNDYVFCHYYQLKDGKPISLLPSYVSSDYSKNRLITFDGADGDKTQSHHVIELQPSDGKSMTPVGVVYNCSSDTVAELIEKNIELDDDNLKFEDLYVNNSMFSIITDSSLISRLEMCRNNVESGSVMIGKYEATDDLSEFVDKFWSISDEDMGEFWTTNPSLMFVPKDTIPHRGKDSVEKVPKNTDTFGGLSHKMSWGGIKATDGKLTGDDNLTLADMRVMTNDMQVADGSHYASIFAHPFYYLQNDISDENDRKKVKTLLFLHTLKWNRDYLWAFIAGSQSSGYESVPYGLILLYGGLLWLRKNKDVIKTDGYRDLVFDGNVYTLFDSNDVTNLTPCICKSDETDRWGLTVRNVMAPSTDDGWEPDVNIKNQFIKIFENFVEQKYPTIKKYELTCSENGSVTQCTAESFSKWAKTYQTTIASCEGKKWEDVERNIKSAMKGNFPQIWNVYGLAIPNPNAENDGMVLAYRDDDREIQTLVKDLYTKKCVVANISGRITSGEDYEDTYMIKIPIDRYRRYVSSFVDTLNKVVDANLQDNITVTNNDSNALSVDYRQFKLVIYYYCKSLWDKWLVSCEKNTYDVDTFFKNNFIFIDSFYRNTYSQLPMNCQHIVDVYMGSDDKFSLFSYLSEIINRQRCIFFALPDYVGFKGDSSDFDTMRDLFKPIPYNQMRKDLDTSNKFVIIYTGKPSEQLRSSSSEYRWDGFDIYAADDDPKNPPEIFRADAADASELGKDYHVPSFGVALNRQNNTIFKGISMNTNNPVQTESAINMMDNILQKAATGENKVVFHGQDMYNVFSNYSYQVEVEMLGNAQIAPLMYFQLLNIPMWRGAYMIFNVQHNITPGNMATKFKGMKMARTPIPWAKSYMTNATAMDRGTQLGNPYGVGNDSSSNGSPIVDMQDNYPKASPATKDHWHDPNNRGGGAVDKNSQGVTVKQDIIDLFNSVFEEIEALNEGWNIGVTHAVREGTGKSQHYRGEAMDLQIKKNGSFMSGRNMPELIKVIDILYCNHRDVCGQVLLEYKGGAGSFRRTDESRYGFHVLHVALQTEKRKKMEVNIVGNRGSDWFNKGHADLFMKYVQPEFDAVAYRAYKESIPTLISHFSDYGTNHSQINNHFKSASNIPNTSGSAAYDRWFNWSCSWEGKKSDGSEEFGWTQTAQKSYINKFGEEAAKASVYEKARKLFWETKGADKITDDNIAVICMWVMYWTGNTATIMWALDGIKDVSADKYSKCIGVGNASIPGKGQLSSDDINRINSFSNKIVLANRIKYHAGNIIEKAKLSDETIYGDKYPGHRRRWRSISYNMLKMNNEVSDSSSLAGDLAKLWS